MRKRPAADAIKHGRDLRAKLTDAEGLLWWKLRTLNRRGYHFRRQVPFRGYVLDFAEHSAKLVIELDGSHHGHVDQQAHDVVRDQVIARERYLVRRFSNAEIFENLDGIVEQIVREILAGRPPPDALRASTSPQGGGD